jgi:hypothetical protein
MKNINSTFWFRHFLMCHKLANTMMSPRGWSVDNFALSIIESENGRFANDQMNIYFTQADAFFCELHCSEENELFNYLEDECLSMEVLSKLSLSEIENYYDKYCVGSINFSNVSENN